MHYLSCFAAYIVINYALLVLFCCVHCHKLCTTCSVLSCVHCHELCNICYVLFCHVLSCVQCHKFCTTCSVMFCSIQSCMRCHKLCTTSLLCTVLSCVHCHKIMHYLFRSDFIPEFTSYLHELLCTILESIFTV